MKIKIFITAILIPFVLIGCASTATLRTSVRAVSYLNPDINNRPSPVVVTFYQLTSPHAFNRATFFSLYNSSDSALGGSLIDKDSYEIRPGKKNMIQITLSPKTNYLGLVAAYRNTERSRWRRIVAIPAHSGTITLNVLLQTQGISVSSAEKRYMCSGSHCLF